MKQLIVLIGCVFLVFGGCQEVSRNKSGVDVIIEGGGEFPEFLVGTWKCDGAELEIVFEADGTISSAVIPIGKPRMGPDETIDFNNVYTRAKGSFRTGPFVASYIPAKRELTATLYLEHYRIELEDGGVLEGKSEDVFTGKVSEDSNTWQADWFQFAEYYVTAESYKNRKIPSDPNDSLQDTLTFHKVTSSP